MEIQLKSGWYLHGIEHYKHDGDCSEKRQKCSVKTVEV